MINSPTFQGTLADSKASPEHLKLFSNFSRVQESPDTLPEKSLARAYLKPILIFHIFF